jgi:hypothetical protein
MTLYENHEKTLEKLNEMSWTEIEHLTPEGSTLFSVIEQYDNGTKQGSLHIIITPPPKSEHLSKDFPGFYLIRHAQNDFENGKICYENDLKTSKDYDDFMSYVTYHYNHITKF